MSHFRGGFYPPTSPSILGLTYQPAEFAVSVVVSLGEPESEEEVHAPSEDPCKYVFSTGPRTVSIPVVFAIAAWARITGAGK